MEKNASVFIKVFGGKKHTMSGRKKNTVSKAEYQNNMWLMQY